MKGIILQFGETSYRLEFRPDYLVISSETKTQTEPKTKETVGAKRCRPNKKFVGKKWMRTGELNAIGGFKYVQTPEYKEFLKKGGKRNRSLEAKKAWATKKAKEEKEKVDEYAGLVKLGQNLNE